MQCPRDAAIALMYLSSLLDKKPALSFPPDKLHRQCRLAAARLLRVCAAAQTAAVRKLYLTALLGSDSAVDDIHEVKEHAVPVLRYTFLEQAIAQPHGVDDALDQLVECGEYMVDSAKTARQTLQGISVLVLAHRLALQQQTTELWLELARTIASLLWHEGHHVALVDLVVRTLTTVDSVPQVWTSEHQWILLALLLDAFMVALTDLDDRVRQARLAEFAARHVEWSEMQFITVLHRRRFISPVKAIPQLDALRDAMLAQPLSKLSSSEGATATDKLLVRQLVQAGAWSVDDVKRWRTWIRSSSVVE
ncbi:hypothetical protein RI367_000808 [Sorochytrium milnesiophthora]